MKRITFIIMCTGAIIGIAALLFGLLGNVVPVNADITGNQVDIPGPAGSGEFGKQVVALPNGNIVVTDPSFDSTTTQDVGAVYLYNGATRALISTLTGSTAADQVGSGGVVMLENGNYVILSPSWGHDGKLNVGAATWGSMTAGIAGLVSDTNSLVGNSAEDKVGSEVVALTNGNYVVLSPYWDTLSATDAGAATWGNGATGTFGTVRNSNSLFGSQTDDLVGSGYIEGDNKSPGAIALANGNYIVHSSFWNNGGVVDAGAVTWRNGSAGTSAVVSAANSLVGTTTNDLDYINVKSLQNNGNYVVGSASWDNTDTGAVDAGVVTWGDGDGSPLAAGEISSTISLVGETSEDWLGDSLVALVNGNYVVSAGSWDSPSFVDAGAATWVNGATGITGTIDATNSLVGNHASDQVGWSVFALTNGHYVVVSPFWDVPGKQNVGAVTWANGTIGATGTFDGSNSMVGDSAEDQIGYWMGVTPLSNGNYVISSPFWDNPGTGAVDAGAATWVSGTGLVTGVVSAANSLVGSRADDHVGRGIRALTNGNYVTFSSEWDNGSIWDVGAATWGDGMAGTTGTVSTTNSITGYRVYDQIGYSGVLALSNDNYLVPSWRVKGETANEIGAVVWGNGTTGTTGSVGINNSLMGNRDYDQIGYSGIITLDNGDYLVSSMNWDNGSVHDAGAVTWGDGTRGTTGWITHWNSVLGEATDGGLTLVFDFDYTNDQLVVGRPMENLVTFFRPAYPTFMPLILK
jgi:hypothetical protein